MNRREVFADFPAAVAALERWSAELVASGRRLNGFAALLNNADPSRVAGSIAPRAHWLRLVRLGKIDRHVAQWLQLHDSPSTLRVLMHDGVHDGHMPLALLRASVDQIVSEQKEQLNG